MVKSALCGILTLSLPLLAVACGDESPSAQQAVPATPTTTTIPTSTPVPTATPIIEFASDQMVGDWLIVGHGFVVKFSDDGIYKFAPEGVPETEFDALVVERGEWVLNDGVLVMVSDELSLSCQSGQRGVSEVITTGNNLVELRPVAPSECPWRSGGVKLERLQ